MSAAEILKMIETVDPSDTAKLDEIDARVWCWLKKQDYFYGGVWQDGSATHFGGKIKYSHFIYKLDDDGCHINEDLPYYQVSKFTRSRDALKAIRPEGYLSGTFTCGGKWCDQIRGWCQKPGTKRHEAFESPWDDDKEQAVIKTEELAELHAIIQAIEYERAPQS